VSSVLVLHVHPPKNYTLIHNLALHIHLIKWMGFVPYISVIKVLLSYYFLSMFLVLLVYFSYYDFYCNIKCNVGSHRKNTKQLYLNWRTSTLFYLFILYKVLMMV